MSNDKHLILAVRVFERELIDLAQFTKVYELRTADQTISVRQFLERRGWVDADVLAELEQQVQQEVETAAAPSNSTLNGLAQPDFDKLLKAMQETGGNQSIGTLPRPSPDLLLAMMGDPSADSTPAAQRYTRVSEVGRGGLGQVWLAQDNELAREVALKHIKADSTSQEAVRRLIKEAQITAQLQHPNIVPVYEVHRSDHPFYTMKLVRGKTLAEAIRLHHEQLRTGHADPLSIHRLMTVYTSICNALAYAHSRGIIHRDLKPQNIVLGDFGEAIVLDWGLARRVDEEQADPAAHARHCPTIDHDHPQLAPVSFTDDAQTDATKTGAALGTPAYMSPEQAAGRGDLMDARTDVYGLGAILFEIITGSAPHRLPAKSDPHGVPPGDTLLSLLLQIVTGETPHVRDLNPQVPIELDAICARAMAKDRADRYQTANELKAALSEYRIHEQSIALAASASADLATGQTSRLYADFNRALFGFEEALRQWPENLRATEGIRETQLAFAKTAFDRGDFDLAVSLLDDQIAEQQSLQVTIRRAIKERAGRQTRIKYLRRFSLAASLVTAIVASTAAALVNDERLLAVDAREKATSAQAAEARLRQFAENERLIADQQTQVAVREQQIAAEQLVRANQKSQEAREGLYIASLRLAAAQLQNGAIAFCNQTLLTSRPRGDEPDLRGWEWNYLWNQTHSNVLTVEGQADGVSGVHVSPDDKRILSDSDDQITKIWDTRSSQPWLSLRGHDGSISSVASTPDNRHVASGGGDTTVRVWDIHAGESVRTLAGHTATVRSVAFSPDGRLLASASGRPHQPGELKLWEVPTGKLLRTFEGHADVVNSARFSPDGKFLLSGSADRTLKLWEVSTGRMLRSVTAHSDIVTSVSYCPHGRHWISGSRDQTVKIWDAKTGQGLRTLRGHSEGVLSVSSSPCSLRVVSGAGVEGSPGELKVWNIETGLETFSLQGHQNAVTSVCFSQDSKRILSASQEGRLKLWDAQSGQELLALPGGSTGITSSTFCRHDYYILSGGEDGILRLWDGTPESQSANRAIEREARTALSLLRAKITDHEQLILALRKDRTLTPAARRMAIEWAKRLR